MITVRDVALVLTVFASQSLVLQAQAPSINDKSPALNFSVVSIKPSGTGAGPGGYQLTKNGLSSRSGSVLFLIEIAYALPDENFVVGAPAWVKDDHFDLVAKVDDSEVAAYSALKPDDKGALLRSTLKDRFKLAFHFEDRLFPEYALVRAKGGIKRDLRPTPEGSSESQWRISGYFKLDAKGAPMEQLCNLLSTEARQLVRDETGLQGKYDFELRWSRQPEDVPSNNPVLVDAPEIFTAVKEQLGLQMLPKRLPEKVLVIDHIERPTPD